MDARFRPYRRKPGYSGWETILVHSFESGDRFGQPRPGPKGENEVQCYTVDRIPFCMPKRKLDAQYEAQ